MLRKLKDEWFHEDGFPLVVTRSDPQPPSPMHWHEFSELVVITGGHGLHVTGKYSWQLSAGDVFVIGGNRPHEYRDSEQLQLINILFDEKDLALDLMDLVSLPGFHALFHLEPVWRNRHDFKSRLRLGPKDMGLVLEFVDELEHELEERGAGFRFMAVSHFMRMVGFLSRRYENCKNPDSQALLLIAKTITYIESHYSEDIRLDSLAEMAQMSKRSYFNAFEAALDCTPISYVIQLRLTQAAKLLRQTESSITEIAFSVGFNDSNYFSRQFRKQFDVSPRSYRKSHFQSHSESDHRVGISL